MIAKKRATSMTNQYFFNFGLKNEDVHGARFPEALCTLQVRLISEWLSRLQSYCSCQIPPMGSFCINLALMYARISLYCLLSLGRAQMSWAADMLMSRETR
ncbi:hypothetical protein IG631_14692 [Alternaria alternata]|nr:hypothetical protein IG631_14692 [Alternaria alternata]